MPDLTKSPRVYTDQNLGEGFSLSLDGGVHHYIKNVMRIVPGNAVRIFNGRDGEFVGRIEQSGKKITECTLENRIREQRNARCKIHLLFAPIKKERMDFLIEKAVELGATDLHPVLTQNTDIRKINEERLHQQIIEATEQCERMDITALHPAQNLSDVLKKWPEQLSVYAAIERMGVESLPRGQACDSAVLVGPSGGFTEEEKAALVACPFVHPVSLGHNILRSETAAVAALSLMTI